MPYTELFCTFHDMLVRLFVKVKGKWHLQWMKAPSSREVTMNPQGPKKSPGPDLRQELKADMQSSPTIWIHR